MGATQTIKDVQSLNGKLTALVCFSTKSTKQTLPFFQVLKTQTMKKKHRMYRRGRGGFSNVKRMPLTLTDPDES